MVQRAQEDPGTVDVDASNADLSPFLNGPSKMISYHGLSNAVISPLATSKYYDDVVRVSGPKLQGKQVSDSYRHFEIPGMSHCRDGPGAWCFGTTTQNDAGKFASQRYPAMLCSDACSPSLATPGNRPLQYDTKHDMVLALVAWAERGLAPDFQIGASYNKRSVVLPPRDGANITEALLTPTVFRSFEYGVVNTRMHCPYPAVATYQKGPTTGKDSWNSFKCTTK